jgi:hypothetical protein
MNDPKTHATVTNAMDFSKLLGFEQAPRSVDGEVDFRDDAFGARVGAKRGFEGEVSAAPDQGETDRA